VKIKKIAAATLLPAAIAGLTLSTGAAAMASPTQHAAQHRAGPSRAQQWVTVRPGQTLSSIAAAHHITWRQLYATPPNYLHVRNPSHLTVGQRLRIPADPRLRGKQFLAVWRHEAAIARQAAAAGARAEARADAVATPQPITAGMSAFEQCVAWRESGDNPTASSAGLFGILPATWASLGYSGTAGQASVAQQKVAFNRLYAMYGTSPWAPYDGC
jgi:hypothetical protein